MLKGLQTILITLALCAGTVWAGDFEDGLAAANKQDYVTANKKFKIAAEKGNASAQLMLGLSYAAGTGVAQDYAQAFFWFKLAAAQGDADAQTYLGHMYDNGHGVVQDYAEAVRWYKLAAAQGKAAAHSALGFMYGEGRGVVQDYMRAHIWYNLAAVTGNATAVQNRDIIAKKMTPQQIAEAQKLARECQARNFKNCD